MRPQIRSLPLSKVECPQFSWAVRNNSENVSAALQPDLHQNEQNNEQTRNAFVEDHERLGLASNKPCYCSDYKLRPTLFPHPVSCVCSNEPCPPENEKYRHCKVNMDQAIGDVMEEIILETIPTFPPTPAPRTERLMKKIMRSAYIPEQVDLMDETACVECLAKDPTLLKELLDSIKYKKGSEDEREYRKSCLEAGECRKGTIPEDGFDCFHERPPTEAKLNEDKTCKWNKELICTCKELRHNICGDCDKCRCECRKSCLKCTCKKEEPKSIDPAKKYVNIKPNIQQKDEGEVVKTKKVSRRLPKEKEPAETREKLPSPHIRKTGGKTKKPKNKSPKNSRTKSLDKATKSPDKATKPKRPNNIICERFELIETEPFYHLEPGATQTKESSPVQIYENYRAVEALKSGSPRSASEPAEVQNYPKSSYTQKDLVNNKNARRTRVKFKKSAKVPWNWNNQKKIEDPYKEWGGTRYSWSKKLDYAKLGKNLEENNDNLHRSRGGDDVMVRSESKEPIYYEYNLNLRPKNHPIVAADNEDEIKRREQRRYKNGYGRMRVKSWHQTLEENTVNKKEKDVEPSEILKEKSTFSEDDLDEENNREFSDGDHDRKQCLQCLMSDVQQRFVGPSDNLCSHGPHEGNENANLKTSIKMLADSTLARSLNNADFTNEDSGDTDGLHRRRLPTIIEENSGKYEVKKFGNEELDSADSQDVPFFNVIKQRIHSRNKTLENLERFRNELFTKKDHTCVHRFTIDERLFPKPLHCDESGASCCVHCDKLMTPSQKTVFLDQRESKERVGDGADVKKQVSKFSLRPKSVHIGSKNSVMEIRLRPEHDELLRGYAGEKGRKREFYTNSLALRHQRR